MSWSDIKGWFGFRNTYDRMIDEAKEGDTIVEIGTAFGRSIAYLARRAIDSGKNLRIYAVDPWNDDWWQPPANYPLDAPRPTWGGEFADWARSQGGPFLAFISEMTRHAPEELEYIRPLRLLSKDAVKLFGPASLRGVMIDGNHNYEAVAEDILMWRSRVMSGGIVSGDDYSTDFPGVMRAVEEFYGKSSSVGGREYNVDGTTWWVRR